MAVPLWIQIAIAIAQAAKAKADSRKGGLGIPVGGQALAGAGAEATNIITNDVHAYVDNSTLSTGVSDYLSTDLDRPTFRQGRRQGGAGIG